MAEQATASMKRSGIYTKCEIEFIGRARGMLMRKYHMDDTTIAGAIAQKKGWSQGSVEYQIGKMSKNGAGVNRNNRPAEHIIGI